MAQKKTVKKSAKKQPTTEILEGIDSRYRLILLAALRAKQLQSGATVRVDLSNPKMKPSRIALEELKQNKVVFRILEED